MATQLAAALDFAHDHELTHGDLKPANVLVTPGWEVKLTDLGVVSALSSSGLGHANTRWDRPEHLAPEVAEGGPPTPASDRFSLGVLLYSLLTGRLPFQGDDATATLWRIANEQPPLPSDLAPELPATVDGVLLRALAKEPEERYPTCAELADCLARALADRDQPVPAVYATQPLDEDLRRQLRIASATTPLPDEARASEPATPAPRPARPRPAAPTPRRRRRRRLWPWAVLLLLLLAGTVALALPGGR
ncbi:MAG: serine/threonine-protein kinase [Thermoanaerobaculia bacterium]